MLSLIHNYLLLSSYKAYMGSSILSVLSTDRAGRAVMDTQNSLIHMQIKLPTLLRANARDQGTPLANLGRKSRNCNSFGSPFQAAHRHLTHPLTSPCA